ncbi:ribulose-phosphate 3-epimerase [bacterium]|nr:ribulose-phosphate 3-epimerase [bacterium]
MTPRLIAPSLLSADFARLHEACALIESSAADWYHLDVMDGVFVPNLSFGLPVIEAMKPLSTKPFDVHLMIVQPERYFEAFQKAGADVLTVHLEASTHLHRSLQGIRELGMKAGVALNPHTPVEALSEVLDAVDVVCLMSVNPGFGGQGFIPRTFDKLRTLRRMLDEAQSPALIEIDGGVGPHNAKALFEAGANVLVAGNAVFKTPHPEKSIEAIKLLYGG